MHSRFLFSALLTFAFRGRAETAVFRLGSSFLTQNTTSYIKDVNISIIVPPAPSGPNQSVDAFNLFPMIGCDMANNILRPSMNIFEDMAGCVPAVALPFPPPLSPSSRPRIRRRRPDHGAQVLQRDARAVVPVQRARRLPHARLRAALGAELLRRRGPGGAARRRRRHRRRGPAGRHRRLALRVRRPQPQLLRRRAQERPRAVQPRGRHGPREVLPRRRRRRARLLRARGALQYVTRFAATAPSLLSPCLRVDVH